jgi:hypothetical protein
MRCEDKNNWSIGICSFFFLADFRGSENAELCRAAFNLRNLANLSVYLCVKYLSVMPTASSKSDRFGTQE